MANDPFAAFRGDHRPTDKEQELMADTAIGQYRNFYNECAIEPEVNKIRSEGGNPLVALEPEWFNALVAAVMTIPAFQKAMVDEYHCFGLLDFGTATFDTDWLLSVYLRGFYDCFAEDDEESALKLLHQPAQKAMWKAKNDIELVIKKHAVMVISKVDQGGSVTDAFPYPPKEHKIFVARLIELAKHEQDLNASRQSLYSGLMSIPDLSKRSAVNSTVDLLKNKFGAPTLIDTYGEKALAILLLQLKNANIVKPRLEPIMNEPELEQKFLVHQADLNDVVGDDAEMDEKDEEEEDADTVSKVITGALSPSIPPRK